MPNHTPKEKAKRVTGNLFKDGKKRLKNIAGIVAKSFTAKGRAAKRADEVRQVQQEGTTRARGAVASAILKRRRR